MDSTWLFQIQAPTGLLHGYIIFLNSLVAGSCYWLLPSPWCWALFCIAGLHFWQFRQLQSGYPFTLRWHKEHWYLLQSNEGEDSFEEVRLASSFWISEALLILPYRFSNNRGSTVIFVSKASIQSERQRHRLWRLINRSRRGRYDSHYDSR